MAYQKFTARANALNYDDTETHVPPTCIEFGVLGRDDVLGFDPPIRITSCSVCGEEGSVNDMRMGPFRIHGRCATCGKDFFQCPGHMGYIELKLPVYNPLFMTHACKLLNGLEKSLLQKDEVQRQKYSVKGPQFNQVLLLHFDDDVTEVRAEDAYRYLVRVQNAKEASVKTNRVLPKWWSIGRNKATDLILHVLPVVPPACRMDRYQGNTLM